MKFKFKLESVLRVRRHEEELEKQKLGILIQKKKNIQISLQKVQDAINALNGEYLSETKSDTKSLRKYYAFLQDKQEIFWDLKRKVDVLDNDIIVQRQALLEANKKTKMLEKLRSREMIAYVKEMEQKEQLELNEMATQKYNHSN